MSKEEIDTINKLTEESYEKIKICYICKGCLNINILLIKVIVKLKTVDNLAEKIHKIDCKHWYDNKKCVRCGIKYKDCERCF